MSSSFDRIVRYQYFEPLLHQRSVLELGAGDGAGSAFLRKHAKRLVCVETDATAKRALERSGVADDVVGADWETHISQRFDVVIVPQLERWDAPETLLSHARAHLQPDGVLSVLAQSGDSGLAARGVTYEDLETLLGEGFEYHRIFGEIAFSGRIVADFAPEGELDPALDCSLVEEDDAPHAYLALAADRPIMPLSYTVIQLPADADAEHRHAMVEVEQLRERLEAREHDLRSWRTKAGRVDELRRERDELARQLREQRPASDDFELQSLRQRLADAERRTLEVSTEARQELIRQRREHQRANADERAQVDDAEELAALRSALKEARAKLRRAERVSGQSAPARETEPQGSGSALHVRLDAVQRRASELEAQLDRERRRAETAEGRCDQLIARVEQSAAEVSGYHRRIAELQSLRQADQWKVDELAGRLRQLQQDGVAHAQAPPPVQPSASKLEKELSLRRRQLESALHRADKAEQVARDLEGRLERSQQEAKTLKQWLDQRGTNEDVQALEKERDEAVEELARLKRRRTPAADPALAEKLAARQRQLEALLDGAVLHQQEATKLQDQIAELADYTEELRRKLALAGDQLAEVQAKFDQERKQVETLRGELAQMGRKLAVEGASQRKAESTVSNTEQHAAAERALEQESAQRKQLAKELARSQQRVSELEQTLRGREQTVSELRSEESARRGELVDLRRKVRELERMNIRERQ